MGKHLCIERWISLWITLWRTGTGSPTPMYLRPLLPTFCCPVIRRGALVSNAMFHVKPPRANEETSKNAAICHIRLIFRSCRVQGALNVAFGALSGACGTYKTDHLFRIAQSGAHPCDQFLTIPLVQKAVDNTVDKNWGQTDVLLKTSGCSAL